MKRIIIGRPTRNPESVSQTASSPFPWRRSLCPGRTDRAVSSSGAPRKIEGIKSRKVWVIVIDTIKTTRASGETKDVKKAREETIATETKFIWIPGMRPVKMPAAIPITKQIKISIIYPFIEILFATI